MPADIAGQCLILPASSLPLPIITQDQTAMLAAALANIKLPNLHTDPSATCDEANQLTPPSTLPAAVMVMSSALPTKAKVYPLDALLPESSEAPHSTAQPSPSSSSPLRQGNSQQQQQQQQKNTLRQSAGIPAIFLAPDQAASSSSCGGDGGGGGWIDYGQMHLDHMKGRLRPMNEYKSTTSHSTESCPTPLAENLEQTVTITTTTTTTTTPPTSIENNAECTALSFFFQWLSNPLKTTSSSSLLTITAIYSSSWGGGVLTHRFGGAQLASCIAQ